MNILEYIMAIYEKYYRSNWDRIFIYHKFIFQVQNDHFVCLPWTGAKCLCLLVYIPHLLNLVFWVFVLHIGFAPRCLHIRVPSSSIESKNKFWCSEDGSQVEGLKRTENKPLRALDSTKCILFIFLYVNTCSEMSFRITRSCFLFRCYD